MPIAQESIIQLFRSVQRALNRRDGVFALQEGMLVKACKAGVGTEKQRQYRGAPDRKGGISGFDAAVGDGANRGKKAHTAVFVFGKIPIGVIGVAAVIKRRRFSGDRKSMIPGEALAFQGGGHGQRHIHRLIAFGAINQNAVGVGNEGGAAALAARHGIGGFRHGISSYVRNVDKANYYLHTDLFRPPHGWMKWEQYAAGRKRYRVVMWDLVTRDYSTRLNGRDVLRNVQRFARPGSIITFHDSLKSHDKLLYALPRAIEWLRDQGYAFRVFD